MPIPDFEVSGLLPPLLIEGEYASGFSPYKCTLVEVCQRFATSPQRKAILDGLLKLRAAYRAIGVTGFQWLAGSFLEEIETLEGRPPNDIDVATFIQTPNEPAAFEALRAASPDLFLPESVLAAYSVDHTYLPLRTPPSKLVATTRYWYALYTHRPGRVWKGILRIELADGTDDAAATTVLADGQ